MSYQLKTLEEILYTLDQYITLVNNIDNRRNINFPEISEDIVAILIKNIYSNVKKASIGDLICDKGKIEIKAFSSSGPSSFGPTESWDILIFLDCIRWKEKYFKCNIINLANTDVNWQSLKMNQSETYKDQCNRKIRPRIHYDNIKSQIDEKYIKTVFEGYLFDILRNDKLTMIDLFAGTGAFSYVGKKYNIIPIFANDFAYSSKIIYEKNIKHSLFISDIHDINLDIIPKTDLLTGGFPCQAFSIAGKQLGFDDYRSNTFWQLKNIIVKSYPRICILENVKNLTSHDNGKTFDIIINELKNIGYYVKYKVLNTCVHSYIPQNRERIYIICFKFYNDYLLYEFPQEINNHHELQTYIDEEVDEKYFYNNRYPMYDDLTANITLPYTNNTIYQYRRFITRENKSNVCPTLTANMGTGGHNVPLIKYPDGRIRKLTPKECFRLQGFDDDYIISNINLSDAKLYTLAGNAVSVSIVDRIMSKVADILNTPINPHDILNNLDRFINYNHHLQYDANLTLLFEYLDKCNQKYL